MDRITVLHKYRQMITDSRSADHWRDKLRYLLLSPGWHHSDPDERARTLPGQAGILI